MQHIEDAGIHSGDSACVLPPYLITEAQVEDDAAAHQRASPSARRGRADQRAVRHQGRRGLRARGEPARHPHRSRSSPRRPACRWPAWPRASWSARRSTSSACTTTIVPAVRGGEGGGVPVQQVPRVSISILGPEMRSTGEVMGIADSFGMAFAKAQISARRRAAAAGAIFVTVNDHDKANVDADRAPVPRAGLPLFAHRGNRALSARARHPGRAGAQGARGAAERHRPHGLRARSSC